MEKFPTSLSLVRALAPKVPVTCFRPAAAVRAVRYFLKNFPGEILYAVKTNPRPEVLDAVHDAGVRRFDVASLTEVALIAERYPDARISFMHPVKNRDAVRRAYFQYGVRDFALDSSQELQKIIEATDGAADLALLVRLTVPNHHAELELSSKFGIGVSDASELLMSTRRAAARLGVCFHVGSQCMNPTAYGAAINLVKELIHASGVMLDIIDVGGGFPSVYPGMTPPPLADYMSEIRAALETLPISDNCEIWAEPGRALVAEAASILVHVEMRRGESLFINDGTYGSLFDAGAPNFAYPARAVRPRGQGSSILTPYSFYGPTCDSLDYMKGPFYLPVDMREGDYIEIGLTGAYGCSMRTKFNGFYSDEMVLLSDAPMMTMYGKPVAANQNAHGRYSNVTLLRGKKR